MNSIKSMHTHVIGKKDVFFFWFIWKLIKPCLYIVIATTRQFTQCIEVHININIHHHHHRDHHPHQQ